jgi:hypothetical protein
MVKGRARASMLMMFPLAGYSFDMSAESAEFVFHAFIATVEVIDPLDQRFAFGSKSGNDHARRSPQVGRHNGGAGQACDAANDSRVTIDINIGA